MPDFVQTAPYDPSARGIVRNMVAKFSATHDVLWLAWRTLRWLVIHPLALAGIVFGGWLWGLGLAFWPALTVAWLPQLAWAGRVPGRLFASALRTHPTFSTSPQSGRHAAGPLTVLRWWWRIRTGWPVGTTQIGFRQSGRGGQVPWLRHWSITGPGLSAWTACGTFGWTADELATKSAVIAAGIRRCRAVSVTQGEYPGVARVDFAFSDPLGEIIPITRLAIPERGRLSIGLTERGEPAQIHNYLSTLAIGLPGSGKSNFLWTCMASALASAEPFELWVLDPAGGVELYEFSNGSPLVKAYASEPAGMRTLVADLHAAMFARMRGMAGKERLHVPTKAEPRMYLVIDEMLRVWNNLKVGSKSQWQTQLIEILALCRKAAITPIVLTQIPFGHTIGEQTRTLFPQKVLFRVHDHTVTAAAFGGAAESAGTIASKIPMNTPGVGYVLLDSDPGRPTRFRTPYITDAMASMIARGWLPDGVPSARDDLPSWHNNDHVLYQWRDRDDTLLYVGISVNGVRRAGEHLSNPDKARLNKVGVRMEIVQKFTVELCEVEVEAGRTVKQVAEEVEAAMIRDLHPVLNIAHNGARRSRKAIES